MGRTLLGSFWSIVVSMSEVFSTRAKITVEDGKLLPWHDGKEEEGESRKMHTGLMGLGMTAS